VLVFVDRDRGGKSWDVENVNVILKDKGEQRARDKRDRDGHS
jgi:hypothetical protein